MPARVQEAVTPRHDRLAAVREKVLASRHPSQVLRLSFHPSVLLLLLPSHKLLRVSSLSDQRGPDRPDNSPKSPIVPPVLVKTPMAPLLCCRRGPHGKSWVECVECQYPCRRRRRCDDVGAVTILSHLLEGVLDTRDEQPNTCLIPTRRGEREVVSRPVSTWTEYHILSSKRSSTHSLHPHVEGSIEGSL